MRLCFCAAAREEVSSGVETHHSRSLKEMMARTRTIFMLFMRRLPRVVFVARVCVWTCSMSSRVWRRRTTWRR